jgi:hypothetical protein
MKRVRREIKNKKLISYMNYLTERQKSMDIEFSKIYRNRFFIRVNIKISDFVIKYIKEIISEEEIERKELKYAP